MSANREFMFVPPIGVGESALSEREIVVVEVERSALGKMRILELAQERYPGWKVFEEMDPQPISVPEDAKVTRAILPFARGNGGEPVTVEDIDDLHGK